METKVENKRKFYLARILDKSKKINFVLMLANDKEDTTLILLKNNILQDGEEYLDSRELLEEDKKVYPNQILEKINEGYTLRFGLVNPRIPEELIKGVD
jgi:hypothetical protein